MRTLSKITLAFLVAGLIVGGCKKSEEENPIQQQNEVKSAFAFLQNPEGNKALTEALLEQMDENTLKEGSEFMVPLFTSNGFGILKDLEIDWSIPAIVGGELGSFSAEYDENDFWRVNPNGTVSIHLTSNEADGSYYNFGTFQEATGDNCHLNMNYTGEIIEVQLPFPPYVFYFISWASRPAVVYHGNGRVMDLATGDYHNLKATVMSTPGGQGKVTMEFN